MEVLELVELDELCKMGGEKFVVYRNREQI